MTAIPTGCSGQSNPQPKLKPCPICGSGNIQVKEMGEGFARSWVVVCDNCNMGFFYQKVGFIDKNDMIAFWNRRVKE